MLIPERRAHPGEDLLTWMVQAEFDGKKMTDGDSAFFVLLAVASNSTTRHASAQAIYAFSGSPNTSPAHRRRSGRVDPPSGGAALGFAADPYAPHGN